jgi:hypothetical protein
MGGLRTSANFYRRGIPNSYNGFAKAAQANYSIVQPVNKFISTNGYTFALKPQPHFSKVAMKI